jgi:uncharacterized protein (TIGR00296 family)
MSFGFVLIRFFSFLSLTSYHSSNEEQQEQQQHTGTTATRSLNNRISISISDTDNDDIESNSTTTTDNTNTNVVTEEEDETTTGKKLLVATPSMCYHCFDTLIDTVQHSSNDKKRSNLSTTIPEFVQNDLQDPSVECPIFVTWDKQKQGNPESWQLRGCIGTLSPRLLATSVGEYAITSALRDRRFHPITISEISSLRVSVSLLVNYEDCQHVYDWTVGMHGILIKFHVNGQYYNATFLPEVAKQQQWDHEKTVSSLIRKAGYNGPIENNLLQKIHCTRYQSSKCQISFGEYVLHNCEGNNPILSQQEHWQQTQQTKTNSSLWTPCNMS